MYSASYDNGSGEVIFYSDRYPLEEYRILDPNLSLKDSEAGSFTVNIPPTNLAYSDLYRMKSKIVIYDGDTEIWDGRLLSDEYDFYNNRSCTFEGGLSYLIDTSQPQMEYHDLTIRQFVESIISIHNSKVDDDKKFEVGYISTNLLSGQGDGYMMSYRATQYGSTLEALNSLVSDVGGHLKYYRETNATTGKKVRKISILDDDDILANSNQSIDFGVNLLDFSKGYDMSNLATVLVATGQRESSPDQAVPGDEVIVFADKVGTPTNITQDAYNALPAETKASGYYLITDSHYVEVMYQNPGSSVVTEQINKRFYKGQQVYLAQQYDSEHNIGYCMYNVKENNQDQLYYKMQEQNYYLSEPIKIEAGKTYFLSYRVDKAKQYVMYMITRSGDLTSTQNILEYKTVSTSGEYGVEDAIKVSITAPEGAAFLFVCGLGRDIQIQCQESKESLEKLDTYLTMQGAEGTLIIPEGSTLIDKKPGTTEWLTLDYYTNQISDADKKNESNWFYLWDVDRLMHWYQDDDDNWIEGKFKDGVYLINPYMVSEYGWIEKSASWDDISDSESLMLYAFAYLFREQWNNLTINVTAFDLRMLGVQNLAGFQLYQKAYVTSRPHGINNLALPINELSIPLLNPESTTFQLGYEETSSFTEASNQANGDLIKQLFASPTISETVKGAMVNATELINMATTGTITLLQSEDGPDELLIHDGRHGDYHYAAHMWRWNLHGLKFGQASNQSNPEYNGAYNSAGINTTVAITMDGKISATAITTGSMLADHIRGGELILGAYDGVNGRLAVYRPGDTSGGNSYHLLVGDVGDYDSVGSTVRDVARLGVSVQSEALDSIKDTLQIDDGHLYFYNSDKNGTYLGNTDIHTKAIGQIFIARASNDSVFGAFRRAINFQGPYFLFNGQDGGSGAGTTTVCIKGGIVVDSGNDVYPGATNDPGIDLGGIKLKFHSGIFYGTDGGSYNGWTNGSNSITLGQTSLNESQLQDLLNLINNQNGSGGSGSGGSGTSGSGDLTIGNTTINESQLQGLLALLGGSS